MNEIEEDIYNWIKHTSKIRPELGNFAICPFSSKAKYFIVKTNADDIGPIEGHDIVFFIVEDYFDLESLQFWVNYYNKKYPEWLFFEDSPHSNTYIQGISTSNGKYNIITMQNRQKLRQARDILKKTGYYHHWNDEMLKEILKDDYDHVKKSLK